MSCFSCTSSSSASFELENLWLSIGDIGLSVKFWVVEQNGVLFRQGNSESSKENSMLVSSETSLSKNSANEKQTKVWKTQLILKKNLKERVKSVKYDVIPFYEKMHNLYLFKTLVDSYTNTVKVVEQNMLSWNYKIIILFMLNFI